MNLDLKQLPKILKRVGKKIQRYLIIASFVAMFGLYAFLVLQISSASQKEPNQDDVTAQISTIKRLKIDQASIDKIQQLQDQNVVVQSLFEEARKDPFKE